ncbi:zinc finger transcription factor [Colletotrichum incanum]|uniref:Zinc finger transcription factor n=1 Tax=Colletotrichum incanum TaxID=1573173 RepID=A0A162Q240_COLIC|nr:zinc finger transcription factor [Colletotrichum incanum]
MSMRTGERPRVLPSAGSISEAQVSTSQAMRKGPLFAISNASSASQVSQERMSEQPLEHHTDLQDDIMWLLEGTSSSENLLDQSLCFDTTASQELGQGMTPMTILMRRSDTVDSARSSLSIYLDDGISYRGKIHDCTMEVLEIGCLTVVKDPACTTHLDQLLDDTPREMGTVLSYNREVLRNLNNLLDCRCFMRQEVLVLVYLALYKALGCPIFLLWTDCDHYIICRDYCLDNEAQRLVAAHLVLTHLREHVDPLIKRLRHWHPSVARHGSLPPTPSCPDAAICPVSVTKGRMSSVIDQHHQALQEELDRIVSKANRIKRT